MTTQLGLFGKPSERPAESETIIEELLGNGFSVGKFVDAFQAIADAGGSIPRLRELIRSLGVQGRLTRDGVEEGDAGGRAAKEGFPKILFGDEGDRQCQNTEEPFRIPRGWRWVRFRNVASIESRLVSPADFPDLPHVAPDNIEKATGRLLDYRTVGEDGVTSSKHRFFPGQILYSKIRPNLSKVVAVDFEGLCSADMYPLSTKLNREYLHLFMLSSGFLRQVVQADNRLAMPKVNQEQLNDTLLAVPPEAEQARIVARVRELMALCDELEARQAKRRETSTRLTKSALEALTTAEGPDEFDAAWKRVFTNFDILLPESKTVATMRTTILGLAATGRLVTYKPGSRPHVPSGECYDPDFTIPEHWAWAPLGKLCRFIDYRGKTPKKTDTGVRLITAKNVRMGFIREEPREFIAEADFDSWMTRGLPQRGDVLFTTEAPLGNVAQLDDDRVALAQRIITLRPVEELAPSFLRTVLMTPQLQGTIRQHATGITASGIKAAKLKLIPIPVPPRDEQNAIVARVEHLMRVCDELEAQLCRAEDRASKLVEAAVRELVA